MDEASTTSPADRADQEHLKLLAIFHFVVGGLTIAFSSLFIFHVVFGIVLAIDPELLPTPNERSPFPPFFGYMLAAFAGMFVLSGWTIGGLMIYSGRCLQKRTHRMLSLVVAGIACLFMPFGTVLGVLTIVVLCRDSVKRLYGE